MVRKEQDWPIASGVTETQEETRAQTPIAKVVVVPVSVPDPGTKGQTPIPKVDLPPPKKD